MKKFITIVLTLFVAALLFTGCGADSDSSSTDTSENTVIKVGASPTPHAKILKVAKKILAKEGYDLEIVEYDDYVLPNTAVQDGELLANYFQHQPYLTEFNAENGTDIVSVAAIHYEPFGIYPGKTKSFDALADGATIAVPNDTSNEARALLLLEAQGLITLDPDAGLNATVTDITANPKNLQIKEVEAAQLTRVLEDVDLAVINGNYAIEAGLNVNKDALAVEDKDSEAAQTYANIVAVKAGNEDNPAVQALVKALTSNEVRDYINDTYNGSVVPVF